MSALPSLLEVMVFGFGFGLGAGAGLVIVFLLTGFLLSSVVKDVH